MRALVIIALLGGTAYADPNDGYCDYVEGVAQATSAVQFAPELIGQFGYVEQSPSTIAPSQTSTLRLIAGVNYRLTGIYEGFATRDHAHADCRRHNALEQIRGETMSRALAAPAQRAEVRHFVDGNQHHRRRHRRDAAALLQRLLLR